MLDIFVKVLTKWEGDQKSPRIDGVFMNGPKTWIFSYTLWRKTHFKEKDALYGESRTLQRKTHFTKEDENLADLEVCRGQILQNIKFLISYKNCIFTSIVIKSTYKLLSYVIISISTKRREKTKYVAVKTSA